MKYIVEIIYEPVEREQFLELLVDYFECHENPRFEVFYGGRSTEEYQYRKGLSEIDTSFPGIISKVEFSEYGNYAEVTVPDDVPFDNKYGKFYPRYKYDGVVPVSICAFDFVTSRMKKDE